MRLRPDRRWQRRSNARRIQCRMSERKYRIAVVGAGSLLGKEIAEELSHGELGSATVTLMDSEQDAAKIDEVAGEAAVILQVEPASFDGVDVAIFATRGDAEKYLGTARTLGAAVVDASGAGDPQAPVRSPALVEAPLSLEADTVVAAHPVTTMLGAALQAAGRLARVTHAYATVLQPASENGAAALDEMHQQTVNLLSFQALPTAVYDVQAGFNLLPRFGDEATATLGSTAELVRRQLSRVLGDGSAVPVLQWVQAPVFHGFGVSLFLEFEQPVTTGALEKALDGDQFELVNEDDAPASNISVAGESRMQVEVRPVPAKSRESRTFALWLVADNLKLAAQTAVGCAVELTRMRPLGKVQ